MAFGGWDDIDGALQRLGRRMLYEYADPISLVVCGGGALNALNVASRTTKDIDVLVLVKETDDGPQLRLGHTLPETFVGFVAEVGRDLGQDSDWLNMGPKGVLDVYGVPEGMTTRWERRDFGPSLTVYFIHRLDQVHFKVLAAADPKAGPHHMGDLKIWIRPTADEFQMAVDWLLKRKTSPWFRDRLRKVALELGHDDIAEKISE
jgi:hypothetical protein